MDISEDELESIQEEFDTYSLLNAVDQIGKICGHPNPSELRENIRKLHSLGDGGHKWRICRQRV